MKAHSLLKPFSELPTPVRRLPRGVNSLPKEVVQQSQRDRLIEATARAVAERGYAATSVSHVLALAVVSRADFYELFKDKEACFLAGFEQLSRRHLRSVDEAMAPTEALPAQAVAGVTAYLQVLDVDPILARAFFVEAEAASPAIRLAFDGIGDLLEARIARWFDEVRMAHPTVPACSEMSFRVLRAGFTGYLMTRIRAGTTLLTDEVGFVAGFLFSTLGLYRWARLAAAGEPLAGPPREALTGG